MRMRHRRLTLTGVSILSEDPCGDAGEPSAKTAQQSCLVLVTLRALECPQLTTEHHHRQCTRHGMHEYDAHAPPRPHRQSHSAAGLHHGGASLEHPAHALSRGVSASAGDPAALDATALQSALAHGGRELTVFPATTLVTGFAGSVLDALLGVGVNEAVAAIFGRQPVPVDLAQLFEDALKEIDRIVGDRIAELRLRATTPCFQDADA